MMTDRHSCDHCKTHPSYGPCPHDETWKYRCPKCKTNCRASELQYFDIEVVSLFCDVCRISAIEGDVMWRTFKKGCTDKEYFKHKAWLRHRAELVSVGKFE